MNGTYSSEQWARISADTDAWWAGTLDRPLIQVRLSGAATDLPKPELPFHDFTSFYHLDTPVDRIMEAWAYELATTKHLGDAYPTLRPNLGAAIVAAFLGAELINGKDTTWFHAESKALEDLHFEYDPDNIWLQRARELYRAAVDRFEGAVQLGMTDLAAPLDILSVFRNVDLVMMDLYDEPELLRAILDQLHTLIWQYFDELNAIIEPVNPGYNGWDLIFSSKPYYISQCDSAYMLGPDMYERFVKPELEQTYERMENSFYHMDGVGQQISLDHILSMERLKGVQWVPGDGSPNVFQWPAVYQAIHKAGKRIQVIGSHAGNTTAILDTLQEQIGDVSGVVLTLWGHVKDEAFYRKELAKWGQT